MASDYDKAVEHYRRAHELFPDHYDARYRESQVLLAAGRKLEAARALHALLDVKPDYPTALDRFLELRRELGPAADTMMQER
jgi:tetratricopeptide (TPR) repeat protein